MQFRVADVLSITPKPILLWTAALVTPPRTAGAVIQFALCVLATAWGGLALRRQARRAPSGHQKSTRQTAPV